MSEQQAEPISGESGSSGPVTPQASGASSDLPITSLEPSIRTEAPDLVPDEQAGEAPEVKVPEVRVPQARGSEDHAPEIGASEFRASQAHTHKPNSPFTSGQLMIMSPGDRGWANENIAPDVEARPDTGNGPGKRRFAAMAAVAVLAMVAGAIGGAVATASFGHSSTAAASTPAASDQALAATVARIDSDLVALKASVEHTSKIDVAQFNKTSDRLDKLEKAQAEPAAKLAKLSEAVEKLHAAPPAAAPQPASKEVTGSINAPAAAAATAAPKPDVRTADAKGEFGRLPTLDDWVLRDVGNGGALIEGRRGMYEVYAGDPVPGLGRIDAIRRQDGRWVVVTSRGLIVAR
ncbi:MAG TPA: hypothetical protein VHB49_17075 [Bradyrhizobium sp.]|nr:hypothetical protein [Bradyrhizobium sp.]